MVVAMALDLPVPSPCAQWWDNGRDGTWDSVERYEYDEQRFLTTITIDDDLDGAPEVVVRYTRDAEGRPALARHDDDADGRTDRVTDCTRGYCSTNWIPVCPADAACTRNELGLVEIMDLAGARVVNDYRCWTHTDTWRYVSPPRTPPQARSADERRSDPR